MPLAPFEQFESRNEIICVVGLGYVGLPLAALFASRFKVVGFDIDTRRVRELMEGSDRTRELTSEQLKRNPIEFSTDPAVLAKSRLIIVTVPTPIDGHKNPDLTPLVKASMMIGQHIRPGTCVVYESTVYPGCTQDDCLPLIERASGLKWKTDFFAGYSPERINPGDKEHTVDNEHSVDERTFVDF
jgi:UDP-N-acetyl-D-glucosamine/UDP-N-acetyl-D-galactosamine dehydrogenase